MFGEKNLTYPPLPSICQVSLSVYQNPFIFLSGETWSEMHSYPSYLTPTPHTNSFSDFPNISPVQICTPRWREREALYFIWEYNMMTQTGQTETCWSREPHTWQSLSQVFLSGTKVKHSPIIDDSCRLWSCS